MSQDIRAIRLVNQRIKERREAALEQNRVRKEEIHKKIPTVKKIDENLSLTAYEIVALVARGDTSDEALKKVKEKNKELRMKRAETLVEHGYPLDYLDIKYSCKKCEDRGYIDEKPCSCFEKELQKCALECFEIMKKYKDADIKNFKTDFYPSTKIESGISPKEHMTRVFHHSEKFIKSFGEKNENLLLYGPSGLGKTFLSICIAKELIKQGYTVSYYTAQELFSIFEKEKFSQGSEPQNSSEEIFACDLLIIDDLGTEFMTSFIVPTLYGILNKRILLLKSTIINTNYNPEEIFSMYSMQVASRLKGDFTFLEFLGEDIRFLKRKNEIKNGRKKKDMDSF